MTLTYTYIVDASCRLVSAATDRLLFVHQLNKFFLDIVRNFRKNPPAHLYETAFEMGFNRTPAIAAASNIDAATLRHRRRLRRPTVLTDQESYEACDDFYKTDYSAAQFVTGNGLLRTASLEDPSSEFAAEKTFHDVDNNQFSHHQIETKNFLRKFNESSSLRTLSTKSERPNCNDKLHTSRSQKLASSPIVTTTGRSTSAQNTKRLRLPFDFNRAKVSSVVTLILALILLDSATFLLVLPLTHILITCVTQYFNLGSVYGNNGLAKLPNSLPSSHSPLHQFLLPELLETDVYYNKSCVLLRSDHCTKEIVFDVLDFHSKDYQFSHDESGEKNSRIVLYTHLTPLRTSPRHRFYNCVSLFRQLQTGRALATAKRFATARAASSSMFVAASASNTIGFFSSCLSIKCDERDMQQCLQYVQPILTNTSLGYAVNGAQVEQVCQLFRQGMRCVDDFVNKCFDESRRLIFRQSIKGAENVMNKLCYDHHFQAEYIRHAKCYVQLSDKYERCTDAFKRRMALTATEHDLERRILLMCSALQTYLDCAYTISYRRCGLHAAMFLKKYTQEAAGDLVSKACEKYLDSNFTTTITEDPFSTFQQQSSSHVVDQSGVASATSILAASFTTTTTTTTTTTVSPNAHRRHQHHSPRTTTISPLTTTSSSSSRTRTRDNQNFSDDDSLFPPVVINNNDDDRYQTRQQQPSDKNTFYRPEEQLQQYPGSRPSSSSMMNTQPQRSSSSANQQNPYNNRPMQSTTTPAGTMSPTPRFVYPTRPPFYLPTPAQAPAPPSAAPPPSSPASQQQGIQQYYQRPLSQPSSMVTGQHQASANTGNSGGRSQSAMNARAQNHQKSYHIQTPLTASANALPKSPNAVEDDVDADVKSAIVEGVFVKLTLALLLAIISYAFAR